MTCVTHCHTDTLDLSHRDADDAGMTIYLITWSAGVLTLGLPILAGIDRAKAR